VWNTANHPVRASEPCDPAVNEVDSETKAPTVGQMNRSISLVFLAVIAMGVSGCAQYEEKSMAGNAVDIPDDSITSPSPAPVPLVYDSNGVPIH
jgi:hypothetical protein